MEYVLDASAFINVNGVPAPGYTTPEVLDELRSEVRFLAEGMIAEGTLKIRSPSPDSVERVRAVAREAGEDRKLSRADISVLALALDLSLPVLTDDFHVQNVAALLGIPFSGVTEEIREVRVWKKRCVACGKTFDAAYTGQRCPRCGGRVVYSSR